MSKSTLSQVLAAFTDNKAPMTMSQIARDLDISLAQLDGMIQYWVRKGKLRETASYTECGTCGHGQGGCPYVMELPRSYELVTEDSLAIPLTTMGLSCTHQK